MHGFHGNNNVIPQIAACQAGAIVQPVGKKGQRKASAQEQFLCWSFCASHLQRTNPSADGPFYGDAHRKLVGFRIRGDLSRCPQQMSATGVIRQVAKSALQKGSFVRQDNSNDHLSVRARRTGTAAPATDHAASCVYIRAVRRLRRVAIEYWRVARATLP